MVAYAGQDSICACLYAMERDANVVGYGFRFRSTTRRYEAITFVSHDKSSEA